MAIQADVLESTATGATPPLKVASTTKVANLNVEEWGGYKISAVTPSVNDVPKWDGTQFVPGAGAGGRGGDEGPSTWTTDGTDITPTNGENIKLPTGKYHKVMGDILSIPSSNKIISLVGYDPLKDATIITRLANPSSAPAVGLEIDRNTGAIKSTQINAEYRSSRLGTAPSCTTLHYLAAVYETGISNIVTRTSSDFLGDIFTINKSGIYSFDAIVAPSSTGNVIDYTYITKNTAYDYSWKDLVYEDMLDIQGVGIVNSYSTGITGRSNKFIGVLSAGDIVRIHSVTTNVFNGSTDDYQGLRITLLRTI